MDAVNAKNGAVKKASLLSTVWGKGKRQHMKNLLAVELLEVSGGRHPTLSSEEEKNLQPCRVRHI